jgi:hypothetical protein
VARASAVFVGQTLCAAVVRAASSDRAMEISTWT